MEDLWSRGPGQGQRRTVSQSWTSSINGENGRRRQESPSSLPLTFHEHSQTLPTGVPDHGVSLSSKPMDQDGRSGVLSVAPPTFLSLLLPPAQMQLTSPHHLVSVSLSQTDLPQLLLTLHLQHAPFPHLWIRAEVLGARNTLPNGPLPTDEQHHL
jgi:hypothetical protein